MTRQFTAFKSLCAKNICETPLNDGQLDAGLDEAGAPASFNAPR